MLAVTLALGSSLAWGLADFLGGVKSRSLSLPALLILSQAVGLVITAGVLVALAEPLAAADVLLWAAASGALDLIGLWVFYRGLAVGSMSVVAPLAATAGIIPVAVGLMAGERPSTIVLGGIALAVVGVALAGRSESEEEPGTFARGVGFALVAAVCFGLGFVALDTASEGSVAWTLMANRVGSVVLLLAVWWADVRAGEFSVSGEEGEYVSRAAVSPSLTGAGLGDYAAVLTIGVLDLAAVGLFALASTQGLVSVVAALGSLYPVATVVLARLVLRERMTRAQLLGVSLALFGVLAISGPV